MILFFLLFHGVKKVWIRLNFSLSLSPDLKLKKYFILFYRVYLTRVISQHLCRAKWSHVKGQSVILSPTWRFEQLDRPVTLRTARKREELSSESRLPISNNCTFSDRAAFAFVSARQAGPPRRVQGSEKQNDYILIIFGYCLSRPCARLRSWEPISRMRRRKRWDPSQEIRGTHTRLSSGDQNRAFTKIRFQECIWR